MSDSLTYPQKASACRKGGYLMIDNHPCKIIEMSTSKTGKHGHAKVTFKGKDVFTDKTFSNVLAGHMSIFGFSIQKKDYEIQDLKVTQNDGEMDCVIEVLDENDETETYSLDMKNPEMKELVEKYTANEEEGGDKYYTVNVLTAPVETKKDEFFDHVKVMSYKEMSD